MTFEICSDCGGDGFVDCDDRFSCLQRSCDGDQHDCRTCLGTGEVEIDEEDDEA